MKFFHLHWALKTNLTAKILNRSSRPWKSIECSQTVHKYWKSMEIQNSAFFLKFFVLRRLCCDSAILLLPQYLKMLMRFILTTLYFPYRRCWTCAYGAGSSSNFTYCCLINKLRKLRYASDNFPSWCANRFDDLHPVQFRKYWSVVCSNHFI